MNLQKKLRFAVACLFLPLLCQTSLVAQEGAGTLVPPSGPEDGTFRTLGEIWDKVVEIEELHAEDPAVGPSYLIDVEVEGIVLTGANFSAITGIGVETEIIEFQDGDDIFLRKRPGRTKFANITLKRGFGGDSAMFEWYEGIQNGISDRREVNITLQDSQRNTLGTLNLSGCWPSSWKLTKPEDGGPAMTEEFVLAIEGLSFLEPGTK